MPTIADDERSKKELRKLAKRYTNPVRGQEEVTEEMVDNIAVLAVMHEIHDEYAVEKLSKLYAEPIYYLHNSLKEQMGVTPDDLVGATEREIQRARHKRTEIEEKLKGQVARQFRFWNITLNNASPQ